MMESAPLDTLTAPSPSDTARLFERNVKSEGISVTELTRDSASRNRRCTLEDSCVP